MSSRVDFYRGELNKRQEWDDYLLQESKLPGPRANLELLEAVVELGDEALFQRYIKVDPLQAPANTPGEFLACCGTAGLGKLLVQGKDHYLETLRSLAADPRWRVREMVVMALERWGRQDMPALIKAIEGWKGNMLEWRAAIAALCHPHLLKQPEYARQALQKLDEATALISRQTDRKDENFRILRQGLGYCWSIGVAAFPEEGKPLLEKWSAAGDPDVRWIIRENLKKNRLQKAEPEWVQSLLSQQT